MPQYQAALAAVKRTVTANSGMANHAEGGTGATPAMRVARMQAAANFRALLQPP